MLSQLDVETLRADPSPDNRAGIAEKVAHAFASEPLGETERAIALAIFEALINDAEVLVRRRFAEAVKSNPDLPHPIAQALAFDVAEVATPILRHSLVLTDEDLMAVIGRRSVEHALAIAERPYIAREVTGALLGTGNENVIVSFLANKSAQISEPTYHAIIDAFGQNKRITDALSLRTALPFRIVERLVTLVADETRERLVRHYGMTPNFVATLMASSREQVLLDTYVDGADADEVEDFVRALHRDALLTPTLIMRAHCHGEFVFTWNSLARLARVPAANAMLLMLAPGQNGASQLYDKSNLPAGLKPVFLGVLQLAERYKYTGDRRQRGPFLNRVHDWAADQLGIQRERIGFEQVISKLLIACTGNAQAPATPQQAVSAG